MIAALAAQGGTAVRLDTERYPERTKLSFAAGPGAAAIELRLDDGRVLRGSDVTAVLYRHRRFPRAPAVSDPAAKRMAESELLALLDGALLSLGGRWVNHPAANQLARHKPLQLALAHAEGFTVPPTCITDDPARVRALWKEWDGQMIAKLVGGQLAEAPGEDPYAVFTTRLEAGDLADDAAIEACPAIYQRLIEKDADLRATVVGEQVFACRIPSQRDAAGRVDWRRAGRTALAPSPIRLDDVTTRRCVALTRRLGLELAGIDLVLTPSGEIVFLEINASGQWAWIEAATGMPIAAAIADRLLVDDR